MKRLRITISAIIAMIMISSAAMAAKPSAFLKKNNDKLATLLGDTQKNKNKIIKVVGKMLDFDTVCERSLGKHWEKHSDEQREEFTSTLRALIEKNLVNRLKDTRDHKVTMKSETVEGKKASVVTLIAASEEPRAETTEVEYKMIKKGLSWQVVDMVTDGISLVNNYRSQFNKIITNDGWDALMKKMKDKLAQ
jgi:phospholipid transport system substrate-binding protein